MSPAFTGPSGVFALAGAPLWIAVALAVLAWVGAALLERRRADAPRRRTLRLALLAAACVALFLLAAQPLRWRRVDAGEAVLLTSGASARDLAAATAAGLPAWAVPAGAGEPPAPAGAVELPDAASLARLHPEVSRLRLAGHGLAAWELAELPLLLSAETPPALPFGFARVAWPRRIALGESVEVGGLITGIPSGGATVRVTGPAVGEASIRLAGAGGTAGESARVRGNSATSEPARIGGGAAASEAARVGDASAEGEAATVGGRSFRLRVEPRGPGRHLLELRVEAPGRPASVESLDVEVVDETPPAVLWLDAAPSAEGREMKRWLADAGGAFAWRAQLSRGIARDDAVGTAPLPRGPLTGASFARFDLVVADSRALAGFGAAERAALTDAVREQGVGLLLRSGSAPTPAALGVSFPIRGLPGGGELAARVDFGDGESAPLPLPARELLPAPLQVPLVADRAGRALGVWRPLGAGAVGVSLVDDTWRWVLAGRADDHRRYWREVIAALARRAEPQARWQVATGPLLVGTPLSVALVGSTSPPPAATVRSPNGDATAIPLRRDEDEPSRWSTTFWPRESGWHSLGEGSAATPFWVAPADHWTTWRLAARQEATAARAATPPDIGRAAEPVRQRAPVARWPFFLLLLASLVTLWADEQFGARRPAIAAS